MWETHTDAGSGRPYYYNPETGVTTWESPFEAAEGAASPATSPASVGSHESLETEWGQYWDEESRRVFFYNPLTGETAWEDELEDQPEDEQEMQPGLSPSSPRDRRVRGGALPGWAGLTLRASDPASCARTALASEKEGPWSPVGGAITAGLWPRLSQLGGTRVGGVAWAERAGRQLSLLALSISGSSAPCSPPPPRRTTPIC